MIHKPCEVSNLSCFLGSVDQFVFTHDERFMVALLNSGEVHCMKILDKEREDFQAETQAFLSRFQPIPTEVSVSSGP